MSDAPLDSMRAFEKWAPPSSRWSRWAMPTIFTSSTATSDVADARLEGPRWPTCAPDTAFVVDLPAVDSVRIGAQLARAGAAPVPLFNGVRGPPGSLEAIDTAPLANALFAFAPTLPAVRAEAAPAFLLDVHRCKGRRWDSVTFDNRWLTSPADFPSAQTLIDAGVTRVVLVAREQPHESTALGYTLPFVVSALGIGGAPRVDVDLADVLARFTAGGLTIARTHVTGDGLAPFEKIHVDAPNFVSRWWAYAGLERTAAGGFGRAVPTTGSVG